MTVESFIASYQQFFLLLDRYFQANTDLLLALTTAGMVLLLFMRIFSRCKNHPSPIKTREYIVEAPDVSAIAGDDVITTELDLAKAYLEMGDAESAKKILQHAANHGSPVQQQQAHDLMRQAKI